MAEFIGKLFGPLTGLISGVLELFHSVGAPWWLSIVLLTISVRALLLPLTIRQVRNMRAMQELKPEVDEIRSKYKVDRQKQQQALMDLYKDRRVNPLAGFLPVLVQVPVFITMYQVVRSHEETFPSFASGGLLWFNDLTRADPYFVLPVLSASILLAAGEVSARNVDPQQRRLMRVLPVLFTAFIVRFPAGLFVYWVTSNSFTLIQNLFVYRHGRTQKLPAPDAAEGSNHSDRTKGTPGPRTKRARSARRKRKKR